MNALASDLKVVNRQLDARSRAWLAAIAFCLGAGSGIFGTLSIAPSCAVALSATVPSAVLGVGEYLCKSHEGLKNLRRTEEDVYAFTCRELAEFPRVPITIAGGVAAEKGGG